MPKPTKAKPSEVKKDEDDDVLEVKPKKEPAAVEEEWEDESEEDNEKGQKKVDGESDDEDDGKEAKKASKVRASKRK